MPLELRRIPRRAYGNYHFLTPVRILVASFAICIILGSLLLMLPNCRAPGNNVSYIDALFTATSAVCVTGLVTKDTSETWTRFGQIIILLLIQSGGLGMITFGSLFAMLLGQKIRFYQRALLKETYGPARLVNVPSIFRILAVVAGVTFTVESIGAVLLYPAFLKEHGYSQAVMHSLFHSVSAFCNAGFSTFPGNLESYQGNIYVNLIICALIVLGGLGFPVHAELLDHRRNRRRLSLHTRVVLRATLMLILAGAFFIFILETIANQNFRELPLLNRILASIFHSITPRTAGFNTIPISEFAPATLIFIMVLMFIGGSPAGTAGGVKTTTFVIALSVIRAVLKGSSDVVLFDRRLERSTIRRAPVLILMAMGLITFCVMILLLTGSGSPMQLSFEAVSAFGTVGLSTGITPHLTTVQKSVIILLMFIGRVGPLAFALSFARPKVAQVRLAETELLTG